MKKTWKKGDKFEVIQNYEDYKGKIVTAWKKSSIDTYDFEDKDKLVWRIGSQVIPYKEESKIDKKVRESVKAKREFKTGAIRDTEEGKEDYIESISWLTLKRYSDYMKVQEAKYGRGNWLKGIDVDSYERSLMRHLQKYISSKYYGVNSEPDVDHLSAALFNLQGLIHEEEKLKIKK